MHPQRRSGRSPGREKGRVDATSSVPRANSQRQSKARWRLLRQLWGSGSVRPCRRRSRHLRKARVEQRALGTPRANFIPGTYKDIDEVMENSRELVKIEHTLKQIVNVKGD